MIRNGCGCTRLGGGFFRFFSAIKSGFTDSIALWEKRLSGFDIGGLCGEKLAECDIYRHAWTPVGMGLDKCRQQIACRALNVGNYRDHVFEVLTEY